MVARKELAELSLACLNPNLLCGEEYRRSYYNQVLDGVERLIETNNLATQLEAEVCLRLVLSQQLGLGSILNSPGHRVLLDPNFPLMAETGGSSHNPHRRIDNIGNDLAREVVKRSGLHLDLYLEEHGWQSSGGDYQEPQLGIFDSLDGTSDITVEKWERKPTQATGIVITDYRGNFLAGAVGALRGDQLILLIEKGKRPQFLNFDKERERFSPQEFLPGKREGFNQATIAFLLRRKPLLAGTDFSSDSLPHVSSFGGWVLLKMLEGKVDVALDPSLPFHEMIWPLVATKSGLSVSNFTGEQIDFAQIINQQHQRWHEGREGEGKRFPVVISANPKLHNEVLKRLRPRVEEAVLQEEIVY